MKLTIGIGDTSSIDKECGIYISSWNKDSKLSRIPLTDARPIGQRDPKRKGRLRINETRNKACNGGQ